MKFLHTSDWQIGMRAESVGAAAGKVRAERLEAGKRVVALAKAHRAEFILVAGDVFEDNAVDRLLVRKVGEILGSFGGPVFIIPGNHDPHGPGSVWEHGVWKEFPQITVFRFPEPYQADAFTIFPCPLKEKYSVRDPTFWIAAKESEKIAIGLAHGNVEGLPNGEMELPIPRDSGDRLGLDYLALGHWHSSAEYPATDGHSRMAYCGTHETSKFGERESGNVLLVEIDGRGAAPRITSLKTGSLTWTSLERRVDQPGMFSALADEIAATAAADSTLLRVKIEGIIFPEDREHLARLEEIAASRFLCGAVDTSGLLPAPEGEAWIGALPPGPLREAASRLRTQAASGFSQKEREVAMQALLLLFEINAKAAP
jgi:DNA repair exonuclease SbcCD nuclease subunit